MSGIVGIINPDGKPVDRSLLQAMTDFMAFRGPDAQEVWLDGHVGLGHAMLRTTFEAERERQPFSLDGEVWITADARVDARSELIPKLRASGCPNLNQATDPELILHAYHVWGTDCLEHLLGDFAFAIWDGRRRQLFCARDHFGVKPFFYAHIGGCLILSNTLKCVRLHPAVSDELNEQAIADFLLFDGNQELDTTAFADIQRLPPGHALTWSTKGVTLRRYWTLSLDQHVRYQCEQDYIDHFNELLRKAVGDRLRTDRAGVWMSGGLDSTSVAATAVSLLTESSPDYQLHAYTAVYDKLIPDQERHYTSIAAEALGIPIHFLVADDHTLYQEWDQPEYHRPEPCHEPKLSIAVNLYRQASRQCSVLLSGLGAPDCFRRGPKMYFLNQIKAFRFKHLAKDIRQFVSIYGQLPRVGLRTGFKHWFNRTFGRSADSGYPAWLNEDFATRLDLPGRWEQWNRSQALIHPAHPEAYRYITATCWPYWFECDDPGMTSFAVETRHPFMDVRLVNYMFGIPPVPWSKDKRLMREALKGVLPEVIRLRPKWPLGLAGDHLMPLLQRDEARWLDNFNSLPKLANYVQVDAIPRVTGEFYNDRVWTNLRPLSLNYWLAGQHQTTTVCGTCMADV